MSERLARSTRFEVRVTGALRRNTGALYMALHMIWKMDSVTEIDGGSGLMAVGDGHMWDNQSTQKIADRLGHAALGSDPDCQVSVVVYDLEPVEIESYTYSNA